MSSPTQTTVLELPAKQQCLVYPYLDILVPSGIDGEGCDCACFASPAGQLRTNLLRADWSDTAPLDGANDGILYRGKDLDTGVSYYGETQGSNYGWLSQHPGYLDGGVI
jgi:hypothetical protein